jgi:hypothetical protein
MALFGGQRYISLFRTLNRELINDLVDTEVDIFKTSVYDVNDNLYGEAINKIYKKGVRVNCLITHDDQTWDSSEFGPDVNQSATFAFLRDDLLPAGSIGTPAANVVLEVGDVIWWNNIYWEIDATNENQLIVGKTPDTDLGYTSGQRDDFGNSFSIICQTHQTRKSKVQFENIREGYSYGLYNE